MSSVYIHIPFCRSKCEYCDFFSVPLGNENISNQYISALCNEIKWRFENSGKKNIFPLSTVYIGGGTPSLLSSEQLNKIMSVLNSYGLKKDAEITIESNPADLTPELLQEFKNCGINRLSVGIQALNQKSLEIVKRRSDSSSVKNALNLIKNNWHGTFSADIICALPGQTTEEFKNGLNEILLYEPDHISMYSLTIEEETPLGKKYFSEKLSYDFDAADQMWIEGKKILSENGYAQYEVSNFYNIKKGKPCCHNLTYWRLKDYFGFGSGATGTIYGKNGLRVTNKKNIKEYIDFWTNPVFDMNAIPQETEKLSINVQIFEFFMMGLRTLEGIGFSDFEKRFGYPVPEQICSVFDKWIKIQKAEYKLTGEGKRFSLTEDGLLILNSFLGELLNLDIFNFEEQE